MPTEAPAAPAVDSASDAAAEAFFSNQAPAEAPATQQPAAKEAKQPDKKEIAPAKAEAKADPKTTEQAKPEKKTASVFDAKPKTEAKPDANAAAEPAVDRFPEPEKLSETGKTGWKALKEAEAAARNEAANFRAQLETYRKAAPAESADFAKLKSEHQAALDRLAVLDIQSHPDFLNQYVKPRDEAIAAASEVLGWNEVTGVDIPSLLAKGPKDFNAALAEITKGMNPVDASSVVTEMRKAHKLASSEKQAMSNSSALREQLQAKTAAQQKAQFEEVFKEIGYGEGYLEPVVPDDASDEDRAEFAGISEAMKGARAEAEKYAFGALNPKEAARIAAKAAFLKVHVEKVVPRMHKEFLRQKERADSLEAELQTLKRGKNPGSFGGDKSAPVGHDGPADSSDAAAEEFFTRTR